MRRREEKLDSDCLPQNTASDDIDELREPALAPFSGRDRRLSTCDNFVVPVSDEPYKPESGVVIEGDVPSLRDLIALRQQKMRSAATLLFLERERISSLSPADGLAYDESSDFSQLSVKQIKAQHAVYAYYQARLERGILFSEIIPPVVTNCANAMMPGGAAWPERLELTKPHRAQEESLARTTLLLEQMARSYPPRSLSSKALGKEAFAALQPKQVFKDPGLMKIGYHAVKNVTQFAVENRALYLHPKLNLHVAVVAAPDLSRPHHEFISL